MEVTTESNQEIDTLEGFVEESGCELVISPLSDAHIGELMDALLIPEYAAPSLAPELAYSALGGLTTLRDGVSQCAL